jgi:tetratricopeptide (TPR) repeat protein
MTDAFRAESKLPELITILEAEKGQDFQRVVTMGALYEETGDVEKAIATYRKALTMDSKHIDTRVKLVHLLQTAGELEAGDQGVRGSSSRPRRTTPISFSSSARRSSSAATAPRRSSSSPSWRRGPPATRRSSRRWPTSTSASRRRTSALKVLQKLANAVGGGPEPHHRSRRSLLPGRRQEEGARDVGAPQDAHPEQGQGRRHRRRGVPRSRHDPRGARRAEARPCSSSAANVRYKKSYAIALERTASSSPTRRRATAKPGKSGRICSPAPRTTRSSRATAARTSSASGASTTSCRTASPRSPAFNKTPPDIESGRLLAEVQRKLHRLPDAEATLRRVITLAPGDEESMLALERVLVQQQNLLGAIGVLEKLVDVNPKRAREYYQRMAQYAAELYRDDDAIKYAAKRRRAGAERRERPPEARRHVPQAPGHRSRHRRVPPRDPARTTASSPSTSSCPSCSSRRARSTRPTASSAASSAPRTTRSSSPAPRA